MKAYMNFLLKSTFKKKSTYITGVMTYFIIILQLYLMPTVLKQSISLISQQFVSFLFLVFVLIINISVIVVGIFRTGIDDGTEILIVSKSISRVKIVWTKIIVLLICILINSIVCLIIPSFLSFLKYGTRNPFPYCFGLMILSIIISLFFGAITILACLGLKKNGAALTSVGVGTVMCVLSMVNSTVFVGPGAYTTRQESFTLSDIQIENKNINTNDAKNKKSYSNVTFLKRMNNFILNNDLSDLLKEYNLKTPDELIPKIYNKALVESNAKGVFYYDPILQWLQLINLSNFYIDKQNTPINQMYPSSLFSEMYISNAYLKFSKIPEKEKEAWASLKLFIKQNLTFPVIPFKNSTIKFKVHDNKSFRMLMPESNKYLLVPEISLNPDGTLNKQLSMKMFNIEECIENRDTNPNFNQMISTIDSFVNKYNSYKEKYKEFNLMTGFNLYTFILSYYSAAANIILDNFYLQNPSNEKILLNYYGKKPVNWPTSLPWPITKPIELTYKMIADFLNKNNIIQSLFPKFIKPDDINNLLKPSNPNSPLVSNQNYLNADNINLLYIGINLIWSQLSNMQQIQLESLKDSNGVYKTVDLNIPEELSKLRFLQSPNDNNHIFLANLKTLNMVMNLTKSPITLQNKFLVNKIFNQYKVSFNNAPYGLVLRDYLATAINYKVSHFLNLGWFITFWLIIAFIFLIVASFVYLKKDFK